MWPNDSIFHSTSLLLIFLQGVSAKNIYHHKYLPAQWKATAHAFTQLIRQQVFRSIFSTMIKLHSTSLDSTQLTQQGDQTARFFPRFFVEYKLEWKIESFGQGVTQTSGCNCLKLGYFLTLQIEAKAIAYICGFKKLLFGRRISDRTWQATRQLFSLNKPRFKNFKIDKTSGGIIKGFTVYLIEILIFYYCGGD